MPEPHFSTFRVFDATVQSEIDLPELDVCGATSPDFSLVMAPATRLEREYDWFHHWYQDEAKTQVDSSVALEQGGYRIRFWGQSDFVLLGDGRRIICEPCLDIPLETIRHLFLDHVLPRILGQRGEVILHASAVKVASGTGIGFVGKSGWGKSTLASSFRESGARLLGDDCLQLVEENDMLVGIPAYGGSRLWEDSVEALFPDGVSSAPVSHSTSKRRIDLRDNRPSTHTVFKALFFLQSPESVDTDLPVIQLMSGSKAIVELIKLSFLLDVKSVDSAAGQFAAIGKLLRTRPLFYTLQYPREYSRLPEVRKAILDTISSLECAEAEKRTSAGQEFQ